MFIAILCACRYVKTLETSLEAAQRKKLGTDARDAKKARPHTDLRASSHLGDCLQFAISIECAVWLHVRTVH